MDMNLNRIHSLSDGIFDTFQSVDGSFQCNAIEHAYWIDGAWTAKIPPGVYTCRRRMSPHFGYPVFEVLEVPNCTYIEIHIANTEKDVIGCIGLGEKIGTLNSQDAVLQSKKAFDAFMDLQEGVDEFQLTVA